MQCKKNNSIRKKGVYNLNYYFEKIYTAIYFKESWGKPKFLYFYNALILLQPLIIIIIIQWQFLQNDIKLQKK